MSDDGISEGTKLILSRIVAEMRAQDLVETCRLALADAPHWRVRMQDLLKHIDKGHFRE